MDNVILKSTTPISKEIEERIKEKNGRNLILDSVKSERNVMETKKVFEETGKLGNEIGRLHKQLDNVNMKILELMEECPHEIVFKYTDNHPRKEIIDGSYYCPACGKYAHFIVAGQELPFKTSIIIPLTNLSLVASSDLYRTIRNEVYMNMDFYYNSETPIEELTSRMESLLEDKQTKYESPVKTLRKTRKNK